VAAKTETFSTRWAMMLAMLGMAVGTGNIWRFPRIVAQNGGGEFLVPWIVFLFMWSIPLIMVEFGLGRKTRSGPVAAFLRVLGPKWAWMGAWIAFVATAIMFYYAVVTGWTLRYIWAALAGQVPGQEPGTFWNHYTTSWWPLLTHGLSIVLGVWVVARGVTAIERVAKVMMPTLIVLVLVLAIRAVTLPGAGAGLHYLFHVDWRGLGNANLWVQALTQNAWDTGAGWGLVLCYAAYLRQREDTTLNAVMLPAANNMVSLLSGIMVLCTVFAVVPELVGNLAARPESLSAYPQLADAVRAGQPLTADLIQKTIFGAGNEGLTFIWMPQLFARIPFGRLFMLLFFVALAFAAFTSLVSMIELATRVLLDAGLERAQAIRWVGVVGFLLGVPSALSLGVLHNQDWVWGVGLMLSGLFFAIAVIGSGVRKFREEQLNHPDSDLHLGRWWELLIAGIVPLEAVVLLVWWLVQGSGPTGWLNPFGVDNAGTILFQWGLVLVVLLALNRWLVARIRRTAAPAELP
jgi:neurotransmitter:Na+ symporter, NSS family